MDLPKKILWLNTFPAIIAITLSLTILLIFKFLPQKIPLFYSLPWGDTQLANHQQFFILPAVVILISLINSIISWQLHQSQAFFKKILLSFSIITSIILTITFVKIILIFV